MTVTVRLFAGMRESAGVAELALELPEDATVADAKGPLLEKFPNLRDHLARCAYAVNRNYVKPDAPLNHGDELALIPPVSGG
jgi:molybdopterin converting factor subunit 1